jgi:putative hydrolase of the HAD superfamily
MQMAIIFDLDDTLYPQAAFKISGFRAVAEWLSPKINVPQTKILCTLNKILEEKGPSHGYMFDDLVFQLDIQKSWIQKIVQVFIEHRPLITCFPGVHDMLKSMAKTYMTGILTDGRTDVQERKIDALGLNPIVNAILISSSMGLEKPDPRLYTWFQDRFGLPGGQCIYVGDNPEKDFIGANGLGWWTIRVLQGEHASKPAAEDHAPLDTVNSVLDIPNVIGCGKKRLN